MARPRRNRLPASAKAEACIKFSPKVHITLNDAELANFRTKLCGKHRMGACKDADSCPDSHCLTWQRRNPFESFYSPKLCPDIQFVKNANCNNMTLLRRCYKRRMCLYAHSKEEELYHPLMYKTKMCSAQPSCNRCHCPFAHSANELRRPLSVPHFVNHWKIPPDVKDRTKESRRPTVMSGALVSKCDSEPCRSLHNVSPSASCESSGAAVDGVGLEHDSLETVHRKETLTSLSRTSVKSETENNGSASSMDENSQFPSKVSDVDHLSTLPMYVGAKRTPQHHNNAPASQGVPPPPALRPLTPPSSLPLGCISLLPHQSQSSNESISPPLLVKAQSASGACGKGAADPSDDRKLRSSSGASAFGWSGSTVPPLVGDSSVITASGSDFGEKAAYPFSEPSQAPQTDLGETAIAKLYQLWEKAHKDKEQLRIVCDYIGDLLNRNGHNSRLDLNRPEDNSSTRLSVRKFPCMKEPPMLATDETLRLLGDMYMSQSQSHHTASTPDSIRHLYHSSLSSTNDTTPAPTPNTNLSDEESPLPHHKKSQTIFKNGGHLQHHLSNITPPCSHRKIRTQSDCSALCSDSFPGAPTSGDVFTLRVGSKGNVENNLSPPGSADLVLRQYNKAQRLDEHPPTVTSAASQVAFDRDFRPVPVPYGHDAIFDASSAESSTSFSPDEAQSQKLSDLRDISWTTNSYFDLEEVFLLTKSNGSGAGFADLDGVSQLPQTYGVLQTSTVEQLGHKPYSFLTPCSSPYAPSRVSCGSSSNFSCETPLSCFSDIDPFRGYPENMRHRGASFDTPQLPVHAFGTSNPRGRSFSQTDNLVQFHRSRQNTTANSEFAEFDSLLHQIGLHECLL